MTSIGDDFRRPFAALFIQIVHDDGCSCSSEHLHKFTSNAAPGTGNKRRTACKVNPQHDQEYSVPR